MGYNELKLNNNIKPKKLIYFANESANNTFVGVIFLRKGDTTMAEIKDKVVTVESLSALHEHNKDTYMTKIDPTGSGTITIDGINAGFIMLGSNAKLIPTNDGLEIVFLDEETTEG